MRDPLFNSLSWYDLTFSFSVNPLNWEIKYEKHSTYKLLAFGPVKVLILHG